MFIQRFYSTLPDTFANQFKMNVGQMPEDATVADRAFNITQAANAHGGCAVACSLLAFQTLFIIVHAAVLRMDPSSLADMRSSMCCWSEKAILC